MCQILPVILLVEKVIRLNCMPGIMGPMEEKTYMKGISSTMWLYTNVVKYKLTSVNSTYYITVLSICFYIPNRYKKVFVFKKGGGIEASFISN